MLKKTLDKFVLLNDDDDNNDNIADKDQTGPLQGEDDLVKIILRKVLPESWTGTVTLSKTGAGAKIKVWEALTKGTEVSLPKNYTTPTDLPKELWVEGYQTSGSARDVGLKLSFAKDSTPYEDEVKFTIVEIKLAETKFNHTAGNTSDGIDIREDYDTNITVPEWPTGVRKD